MKKSLQLLAIACLLASPAFAHEGHDHENLFPGCKQIKKQSKTDGRTIYKPVGNHFPGNAVLVVAKIFNGYKTTVETFREDGTITTSPKAKLKSTGNCAGHPECLFAQTFLLAKNGVKYQAKDGSIYIRIRGNKGSKKLCRTYFIKKPAKRYEFEGK